MVTFGRVIMKQIQTFITNYPDSSFDKSINSLLAKVKNPVIHTNINKGYFVVLVEYETTSPENENPNHYANVYDHFIYN